jgi:hypothetical protein
MSGWPPQSPLGWAGPAQSELLTHFCGRPEGSRMTPDVPPEIEGMEPSQRLDAILGQERILGFPPFGAQSSQPMVCFSESPIDHLRHLLGERRWRPWGLVFARDFVYDRDGGPVFYARPRQLEQAPADLHSWMVGLGKSDGGFQDWTHEREWRVPGAALDFDANDVVAVLVGQFDWAPSLVEYTVVDGYRNGITGEVCDRGDMYAQECTTIREDLPITWLKARRWFWDGTNVIDLQSDAPV